MPAPVDSETVDLLNSPTPSLQLDALRKLLQLSESVTEATTTLPFPDAILVRVIQLLASDETDPEVQKKAVLLLGNCAISPSLRRAGLEVP